MTTNTHQHTTYAARLVARRLTTPKSRDTRRAIRAGGSR